MATVYYYLFIVEMNAKMIVPPDFDDSGETQYPVMMQVYGGPYSQTVDQKYKIEFMYELTTRGIISLMVDGRGTGFKGRKYRSAVSEHLGKYETLDQVSAAKWIGEKVFVDESRIGIWGWVYFYQQSNL